MDVDVDHYVVLGLPSGEEGSNLSDQVIKKAYRAKAIELHPDKQRDDPNAHAGFLRLKASYEILKDEKARKLFDDLLRVKRKKLQRDGQHDSKRQKMRRDLEEREHSAFSADESVRARREEERIARQFQEEVARIRAKNIEATSTKNKMEAKETNEMDGSGIALDKAKVLKVSWEKIGEDYTGHRLREIFEWFGKVEDVVIKSSKKKVSALVVMASKEGVDMAIGNVLGDISNPLLVLPLQQGPSPAVFSAERRESDSSQLRNVVGKAYEDSVLEKMRKAAQRKE